MDNTVAKGKNVFRKIPYLGMPDVALTSTTQKFVPIAEIVNDMILYKDGGAALVMETSSLNFGLLSEKEQQAVIAAYAALLNSLSFPIQILVRSQRKDITSYMNYLNQKEREIKNDKLLVLMNSYKTFIKESIKKKNVLGKRFFIIIPFSPLELGVTKTLLSTAKRKGPLPYPKSYVVKKAKVALIPKRDHLIRQSGRLGLKLRQLPNEELIKLFYETYNPTPPPPKREDELVSKK